MVELSRVRTLIQIGVSEKLKYACDPNSSASEGYGSCMFLSSEDESILDRDVVAKYSDEMNVLAHMLLGLISERG